MKPFVRTAAVGSRRRVLALVLPLLAIGGAVYVFTWPTMRTIDAGSCRQAPSTNIQNIEGGISRAPAGDYECETRQVPWQIGVDVLAGLAGLTGLVVVIGVVDSHLTQRRRVVDPSRVPQAWR